MGTRKDRTSFLPVRKTLTVDQHRGSDTVPVCLSIGLPGVVFGFSWSRLDEVGWLVAAPCRFGRYPHPLVICISVSACVPPILDKNNDVLPETAIVD